MPNGQDWDKWDLSGLDGKYKFYWLLFKMAMLFCLFQVFLPEVLRRSELKTPHLGNL